MVRSTMTDVRVKTAIEKNFVPVIIDLDKNAELAKKHRVGPIPHIVWVDAEGEVLEHTLETKDPEDLLADIEDVLYALHGEEDEDGEDEDDGM